MTHHPSHGSILSFDPAGGTSYTAIGQVQDISGPSLSRGTLDTTTHDSTDYREFLPGITDPGDVSFSIVFDPSSTTHSGLGGTGLLGDFDQSNCGTGMAAWELDLAVCSGTATWTFDGFLTGLSFSSPVEGFQTADVTVKISGRPTLTTS